MFPVLGVRFAAMSLVAGMLFATSARMAAQEPHSPKPTDPPAKNPAAHAAIPSTTPDSVTEGSVRIGGQTIAYRAVAGALTVAGTDPQDATLGFDGKPLSDSGIKPTEEAPPTARIFYAAYFKKDAPEKTRPITFIYNGGPGLPTMWLHMGTFGPRRIVTPGTQHQEAGP